MSLASPRYFLGVDVGTVSARAGVFDARSIMLGNLCQSIFPCVHDDQLAYRRETA